MSNDYNSNRTASAVVWAVVALAFIGVIGIVVVDAITPGNASNYILSTIVGFIGPTVAALTALLGKMILSKVQGLEEKINGRMNELLEAKGREERMIGRHEGTQAGQAAAIVDSADESIWSKDLEGRILSWNKAAERMLGWNAVEMLGRSVYEIIPEEDREKERYILTSTSRGESVNHITIKRVHKNGHIIEMTVHAIPICDANHKVIAIAMMGRPLKQGKPAVSL